MFLSVLVTHSDEILVIGNFNIYLNKASDPLRKVTGIRSVSNLPFLSKIPHPFDQVTGPVDNCATSFPSLEFYFILQSNPLTASE